MFRYFLLLLPFLDGFYCMQEIQPLFQKEYSIIRNAAEKNPNLLLLYKVCQSFYNLYYQMLFNHELSSQMLELQKKIPQKELFSELLNEKQIVPFQFVKTHWESQDMQKLMGNIAKKCEALTVKSIYDIVCKEISTNVFEFNCVSITNNIFTSEKYSKLLNEVIKKNTTSTIIFNNILKESDLYEEEFNTFINNIFNIIDISIVNPMNPNVTIEILSNKSIQIDLSNIKPLLDKNINIRTNMKMNITSNNIIRINEKNYIDLNKSEDKIKFIKYCYPIKAPIVTLNKLLPVNEAPIEPMQKEVKVINVIYAVNKEDEKLTEEEKSIKIKEYLNEKIIKDVLREKKPIGLTFRINIDKLLKHILLEIETLLIALNSFVFKVTFEGQMSIERFLYISRKIIDIVAHYSHPLSILFTGVVSIPNEVGLIFVNMGIINFIKMLPNTLKIQMDYRNFVLNVYETTISKPILEYIFQLYGQILFEANANIEIVLPQFQDTQHDTNILEEYNNKNTLLTKLCINVNKLLKNNFNILAILNREQNSNNQVIEQSITIQQNKNKKNKIITSTIQPTHNNIIISFITPLNADLEH